MRTEPITCSNPSYKCFTIRCIISSIIRTKISHYRHPYNTQSVAQSNVRFIVFSFASVYGYVVCMCVYNASLPLLCLIYTCISTELDRAVRAFNRVLHLGLINRVCAHREFKCISSNQIRKRFERAFVLNVVCARCIVGWPKQLLCLLYYTYKLGNEQREPHEIHAICHAFLYASAVRPE